MLKKMDDFYLAILHYAGLTYNGEFITAVDEKLGTISIDGKKLTLPYKDNLRNPNGRHIFHPLNENFTTPETAFLTTYTKLLTLNICNKLTGVLANLVRLMADIELQKRVKSTALINIVSNLPEADEKSIGELPSIIKAAIKSKSSEYFFSVFVKKNGVLKDTPYSAIGKINFSFYKEIVRAIDDGDYKVYGYKSRKKDLLLLRDIFTSIFQDVDKEDAYSIGTDHKPFRYFNAVLLATGDVAKCINDVVELLKDVDDPSMDLDKCTVDLAWVGLIKDMYESTEAIRAIPIQTSGKVESKRLNIKELEKPVATEGAVIPSYQVPQQKPTAEAQGGIVGNSTPSLEDFLLRSVNNNAQGGWVEQQPYMTQQGGMSTQPVAQVPVQQAALLPWEEDPGQTITAYGAPRPVYPVDYGQTTVVTGYPQRVMTPNQRGVYYGGGGVNQPASPTPNGGIPIYNFMR